MDAFLAWLEASALGHFMRGTGVWTYAVVNFVHILGLSSLFGAVLVLDLRLLGCWRAIPLSSVSPPSTRIAKIGCAIALLTGVALLATKATEYAGNLFLWALKFPAIALGLANVALLERTQAWREHTQRPLTPREENTLRRFGAVSLVSWCAAMAGGRLTAYW